MDHFADSRRDASSLLAFEYAIVIILVLRDIARDLLRGQLADAQGLLSNIDREAAVLRLARLTRLLVEGHTAVGHIVGVAHRDRPHVLPTLRPVLLLRARHRLLQIRLVPRTYRLVLRDPARGVRFLCGASLLGIGVNLHDARRLVVAIRGGWDVLTRGSTLSELVGVHFLHLNSLRLLARHPRRVVLHRQVVVLSMVLRGAAVVALRVSLARMRALLLDEDALERSSRATVRHHDLLRLVHDLRIVNATRARILLVHLLNLALLLRDVR